MKTRFFSAFLIPVLFLTAFIFANGFSSNGHKTVFAYEVGQCVDGKTFRGGEGESAWSSGCEEQSATDCYQFIQGQCVPWPSEKVHDYLQCGKTVGLESYDPKHTIRVFYGEDSQGNRHYLHSRYQDLGNIGQCEQPQQPSEERVSTCKPGEILTKSELDTALRAANYPGPWDTGSALAAYNRAACASKPASPPVGGSTQAAPSTQTEPAAATCTPTFVGLNKGDNPTWDTLKKIVVPGEQVQVGAFSNSSFTSRLSGSKTTLKYSGPESGTIGLFQTFRPSQSGEYVIRGETRNDQGAVCSSGEARLEVSLGSAPAVGGVTTTTTTTTTPPTLPPPTPTPVTVTVNVTGQSQTQTQTVTQGQPVAATIAKVEPIKTLPKTGGIELLSLLLFPVLGLGIKLIRFAQ